MTLKICVITGSRADYGLLHFVMQGIKNDPVLTLQIIATGMHLSPTFGHTFREIETDGFKIDYKVDMLSDVDDGYSIAESMGQGLIGFAKALNKLNPDLVLVLGDRFEIFSAVAAALVAKIPVAHIHGGEVTIGAFDDAMRHSITKMSHLHFVATKSYRNRVLQLGEDPKKVFLVGGLGVDAIKQVKLLARKELERSLNLEFGPRSLLITFHPATLDETKAELQMEQLLLALKDLTSTTLIFTAPNADTGGHSILRLIEEFVNANSNAYLFESLGQLRYLSCVAQVDGVVGNSSSGLTEVPSFKKGTINIGDRQTGRELASSVINCEPNRLAINEALEKLYSSNFQETLLETINPYGEGGASREIVRILKETPLQGITKKAFYDL